MDERGTLALTPLRCARAAANLPQTTQTPYFNVVGGRVKILDVYGEVTTIIENTGAVHPQLIANPTVGADVNLTSATTDIANDAVGTIYGFSGTIGGDIAKAASGALQAQAAGVIVAAGTIDLKTDASKTGATKWVVLYLPVDEGAYLSVA